MSAMNVILKHLITSFCHFEAFTLFCRKFAIVAIYALFGVKFCPQKRRSCKKIDKYHVWDKCYFFMMQFSKIEGRPSFLEIWPASHLVQKKCPFEGVKPQKNQPTFFGSFLTHIKNTFCKKNGPKRPFQLSAVANIIYRRS